MITLPDTREPLFTCAVEIRKGVKMYFDHEGNLACIDHAPTSTPRLCNTCNNAVIQFIVNDDGTYTCSACGKFPPELLLH